MDSDLIDTIRDMTAAGESVTAIARHLFVGVGKVYRIMAEEGIVPVKARRRSVVPDDDILKTIIPDYDNKTIAAAIGCSVATIQAAKIRIFGAAPKKSDDLEACKARLAELTAPQAAKKSPARKKATPKKK